MNVWRASQRLVTWAWSKNSQIWRSERKVTLIINNWTAHLHVENLKWVEMILLLPDTISHTQPMDQGIIRALEAKYCSLVVRKLILALEKKEPVPKFSILSVMYMLKKTWMLSRTRHSPTASENWESCRMILKRRWMTKRILLKGLEEKDVEENPVQTLGADKTIKCIQHWDR